jgi:hypothetical protein
MAVLVAGLLPYFLADEVLTRDPGAPRGAYALSKLAFLGSLALALALDFERLFFLVIILPVVLGFFVLFGLLSRWIMRATGSPLPAALAQRGAVRLGDQRDFSGAWLTNAGARFIKPSLAPRAGAMVSLAPSAGAHDVRRGPDVPSHQGEEP